MPDTVPEPKWTSEEPDTSQCGEMGGDRTAKTCLRTRPVASPASPGAGFGAVGVCRRRFWSLNPRPRHPERHNVAQRAATGQPKRARKRVPWHSPVSTDAPRHRFWTVGVCRRRFPSPRPCPRHPERHNVAKWAATGRPKDDHGRVPWPPQRPRKSPSDVFWIILGVLGHGFAPKFNPAHAEDGLDTFLAKFAGGFLRH